MTDSQQDEEGCLIAAALTPSRVCSLEAATKTAVLEHMIDVLATSDTVANRDQLADAVFKREELMSTGIGLGLAVPHVRLASVRALTMAVGISREGIVDYESLDGKPVNLVFLIAAPEGQHTAYLRLLSVISSRAKVLNGKLLACGDPDALFGLLTGTN